jgi:hypothetical protein
MNTDSALNVADRLIAVVLNSTNGGTLAQTVDVLDIAYEYTCDATIKKGYLWVPANALTMPTSGSGASLSGVQVATTCKPYCMELRSAHDDYVDFRLKLPGNYLSNLTVTTIWEVAATGVYVFRQDAAVSSLGASSDPALSTGSNVTTASLTGGTIQFDTNRSIAGSPAAGDSVQFRFTNLGTNGSYTAGNMNLLGLFFTWDTSDKNPGVLMMDTLSAAQASTTLTTVNDSNSSKVVDQFPTAVDTHTPFEVVLPSTYLSGGTVRVRWRSANASTNSAKFRVDAASVAVGASCDPTLTTGSTVTSASGGANVVNEFTYDISSLLAASKQVFIDLYRLGTAESPAHPGTVDILSVALEFNEQ